MVIIVKKWFSLGLKKKKYDNGKISPEQSWGNILISNYIRIFQTKIFIRPNIRIFFLGQIYSDIYL